MPNEETKETAPVVNKRERVTMNVVDADVDEQAKKRADKIKAEQAKEKANKANT